MREVLFSREIDSGRIQHDSEADCSGAFTETGRDLSLNTQPAEAAPRRAASAGCRLFVKASF